jgi:HEAT repeat protein
MFLASNNKIIGSGEILLWLMAPIIIFCAILAAIFLALSICLWFINRHEEKKILEFRKRWQGYLFEQITNPEETLIAPEVITTENVNLYIDLLLELSKRFRGDSLKTLDRLAKPYLGRLVRQCMSKNEYDRASAIQAIGTLGIDVYPAVVVKALRDRSSLVRMISFRNLILHGKLEYLDLMIESLSAFKKWNRNLIASLLSSLGPNICESLRSYLASGIYPKHVLTILVVALRQLNDTAAAPVAALVLQHETDRDVAAECLRLLRALGTPAQLPLVRVLCESEDDVIKAQAFYALGSLGDTHDIERLKNGMEDQSPWVNLHAAMGLKEIGASSILQEMVDSNHPKKNLALQALTQGERI